MFFTERIDRDSGSEQARPPNLSGRPDDFWISGAKDDRLPRFISNRKRNKQPPGKRRGRHSRSCRVAIRTESYRAGEQSVTVLFKTLSAVHGSVPYCDKATLYVSLTLQLSWRGRVPPLLVSVSELLCRSQCVNRLGSRASGITGGLAQGAKDLKSTPSDEADTNLLKLAGGF
jgi:hypothetical protein